jgi:PhoH-like ATPase
MLYSGVQVVKDFQKINEFFKEKSLPLDDFRPYLEEVVPNLLLVIKSGKTTALGIVKGDVVRLVSHENKIRGIKARNKEQSLLIELLCDPNIDCITVSGPAGSGKTLLALAYGLDQLEKGKINKIVLCKNLTPLGREIGFLKGDMDDKVRPWMGSFFDNFEVLGVPYYELDDLTSATSERQKERPGRIEISPITFIQGRSISNAVIIVDEAQNLTREIVKQILTRPAENTKIILLGDTSQVIEKDAVKNNGLIAAIEGGKGADFIGHISLLKCVRSRLAEWFIKNL